MQINKKTIVIATGGTGGHIFPSVSLYEFLNSEYKIEIITDQRGLKYFENEKSLKINIINSDRVLGRIF